MAKKATQKTTKARKNGTGGGRGKRRQSLTSKEANDQQASAPKGHNVVITSDDVTPFLDRWLAVKREGIEAAKLVTADLDVVVGEMATTLNVTKAAAKGAFADHWAVLRREERQKRREETNPDTALDYARLSQAMGIDTPLGEWAQEQARRASDPTDAERQQELEVQEAGQDA